MDPDDQRTVRIEVPCDLAAMSAARSAVVEAATRWGFPSVAELEIVMSELLTNAIAHGRSTATVSCSMDDTGAIDVAVTDHAPGVPTLRDVDLTSLDGRGLAIVAQLSARWGTTPVDGNGKTVWAYMPPTHRLQG